MNLAAELLVKLGQGEIPCLFHMITGLYCPDAGGPGQLSPSSMVSW